MTTQDVIQTARSPHSSWSMRPIKAAAALACFLTFPAQGTAGSLMEVYNSIMATDPSAQMVEYQNKAAAQTIVTQKRNYLPKITLTARGGVAYQKIRESGNPVFPSGSGSFDRTRAQLELDQPIYDPTIRPSIDAAKAKARQVEIRGALNTEMLTRDIIQDYLTLARFRELTDSVDRVISRLESESAAIAKKNDAKIAPISDVQSVKLSLAAMKRERTNFTQYMNRALATLGVDSENIKTASLNSDAVNGLSDPQSSEELDIDQKAEMVALRAEVEEYASQALVEKKRSLPTLSVYGQDGYIKDGNSPFGGAIDQDLYEVGLVLKWNLFDRGLNRSKAREYEYLKLAKQAELKARLIESERNRKASKDILAASKQNVADIADLVEQNRILMESSARAYEAGKETYINTINAYLASEAAVRELINSRHDLVMTKVDTKAQAGGWNKALVETVDSLFASSK